MQNRKRVIGVAIKVLIVIGAFALGMLLSSCLGPDATPAERQVVADTGSSIGSVVGGVIAGPSGSAIGSQLGEYISLGALALYAAYQRASEKRRHAKHSSVAVKPAVKPTEAVTG